MTSNNDGPPSDSSALSPDQLTPAARELLEEYLNEYRHRLLLEARRSASRDPGRTIQMADLRAAELVMSRALSTADLAHQARRRALLLAATSVAVATVLGVVANLVSSNFFEGGATLPAALGAIAAIAVAAVAASIAVLQVRAAGRSTTTDVRDLLIEVADLERRARALASELAGTPLHTKSLSRVIDVLEAEQVWSTADVASFRDVMTLRNHFVYEQRVGDSSKEVLTASRVVRRLSEALADYKEAAVGGRRQIQSGAAALEYQVHQALTQNLSLSVTRTRDGRADFLVETPEATVAILVKSRQGRKVGLKDIREWLSLEAHDLDLSTVVVTDGHLSSDLVDLGSIQLDSGRSVRIVKWDGISSTPRLLRAIFRVVDSEVEARSLRTPTSSVVGTFEIYTDRTGKYRFRLRARNGQIVATGDTYDSKATALSAIEAIQRSSGAAEVQDRTA